MWPTGPLVPDETWLARGNDPLSTCNLRLKARMVVVGFSSH